MNYLLDPADCPKCAEKLQLTYVQRRYTRLQVIAILLRAIIIIVTGTLGPTVFVLSRDLIAWATDGIGLHWREQGILFMAVGACAITAVMFIAVLCWRYTSTLSRRTRATCQACGWDGACLVRETWL